MTPHDCFVWELFHSTKHLVLKFKSAQAVWGDTDIFFSGSNTQQEMQGLHGNPSFLWYQLIQLIY